MFDDELYEDVGEAIGDEFGYAEYDWKLLDDEEVARHDAVIEASVPELDGLRLGEETDLIQWAAAQAYAEQGRDEEFRTIAASLVDGRTEHPALDYAGICLELIGDYLVEEEIDPAKRYAARLEELGPDDPTVVRRVHASIAFLSDDEDTAFAIIEELVDEYGDDPEVLLMLGEDLVAQGFWENAMELFEASKESAIDAGDAELAEEARSAIAHLKDLIAMDESDIDPSEDPW